MAELVRGAETIGFVEPVDGRVAGVVTQLQDITGEQRRAGNLGRGYCTAMPEGAVAAGACKQLCLLRNGEADLPPVEEINRDECADDHLANVLNAMRVPQGEFVKFMVKDGAPDVAFADSAEYTRHPDGHYQVVGNVNSFFFREGEGVTAAACFGRDGGAIVVSGTTLYGERVAGEIFSMRPDMRFGDAQKEYDGVQRSYIEYALAQAIAHYDLDPSTIRVNLVAAVSQRYTFKFAEDTPRHQREVVFAGWTNADPRRNFMTNLSNKSWKPGMPASPDDVWQPDYPGATRCLIIDAAKKLGIPPANLDLANPMDPSAEYGMQSSHVNVKQGRTPHETADGYFVVMLPRYR
jgi:hypothetical protein